jgi:acyl-CoA synthetase (AMP-forming)/AMP-acid ligase II
MSSPAASSAALLPPTRATLLSWMLQPSTAKGLRFADGDGWDYWPYDRLATRIRELAGGLAAAGVEGDDVVVLAVPNGPFFVLAFFAVLLAGAIPAPVAPPAFGQDLHAYQADLAGRLSVARPRLLLTVPGLRDAVAPGCVNAGIPVACEPDLGPPEPGRAGRPPAELALLQFTSGSTGKPRAVRVPYRALEANAWAIGSWLAMRPGDVTASWLPMYHDMGLVGCLITPVMHQTDLWLMSPQQFLRDPVRFLRCFGERGASLTAMPPFGLEHIVRRVHPGQLNDLDFSGWRAVIVGGQRVSAGVLDHFAQALAPHGLAGRALLPAYGLAEATLAVTGLPLPDQWRSLPLDPRSAAVGHRVRARPGEANVIVGCGYPLHDVVVTIRSAGGTPLPEDHLGEITVSGPSVAAGYHGAVAGSPATKLVAGELFTADIGFLSRGQLFVLGRRGDSIKVRGRMVIADDIEVALADRGLTAHHMAVLLGNDASGPVAVLVLDSTDTDLGLAISVLTRMAGGARTEVVRVTRGQIPRTTSGKVRRAILWDNYLAGRLASVTDDADPWLRGKR